jgi:hypothetical protein
MIRCRFGGRRSLPNRRPGCVEPVRFVVAFGFGSRREPRADKCGDAVALRRSMRPTAQGPAGIPADAYDQASVSVPQGARGNRCERRSAEPAVPRGSLGIFGEATVPARSLPRPPGRNCSPGELSHSASAPAAAAISRSASRPATASLKRRGGSMPRALPGQGGASSSRAGATAVPGVLPGHSYAHTADRFPLPERIRPRLHLRSGRASRRRRLQAFSGVRRPGASTVEATRFQACPAQGATVADDETRNRAGAFVPGAFRPATRGRHGLHQFGQADRQGWATTSLFRSMTRDMSEMPQS